MRAMIRSTLTVAALVLTVPAVAQNAPMVGGAPMMANMTIVENASKANNLTTLVSAVKQADLVDTIGVPGLPDSWWYHGPRLAFQPVLIWLALYGSQVVDWPFRASTTAARL